MRIPYRHLRGPASRGAWLIAFACGATWLIGFPMAHGAEPAATPSHGAPTGGVAAWPPGPMPEEQPATGTTLEDFVGAKECSSCHAAQYEKWRSSTHGRAGGSPEEVEIIARFDGKPLRFRDGVVVPRVTPDGRHVFRVREKGKKELELEVAAVVGGGHMLGGGTQTFFTRLDDGTLRMLPFDFSRAENVWFAQRRDDKRWQPISETLALAELEHWPPHRALGTAPRIANCENCHASQILVRFDAQHDRYDTRYSSLAIQCEACHGAGRRHIEWARSSARDANARIHIGTLSAQGKDASLRVCFQCHAEKIILDRDYLTGDGFDEHFSLKLLLLTERPFRADGRVRDFGYQLNHLFSDCYVNGSMVCTDCHDPHSQTYRDIRGQPLDGPYDDRQCTACHASKARAASDHTHHPPGSPGSRCTSCHMPYLQHQAVGNLLRFARSDHTIAIPRPAFDARLGIEGACRQCHADQSVAWLERKAEEWWGPIKPHAPMIEHLLSFDASVGRARAAEILLTVEEKNAMLQFAGLAEFVRSYVTPDIPDLEPGVRAKLEALAMSEDLDVSAVALAALHLGAGREPATQKFLSGRLAELGPRELAVRRRWARALAEIAQRWRRAGRVEPAALAWERFQEIRPGGQPRIGRQGLTEPRQ